MSETSFQTALKEADRAAKKQKTCANMSANAVSTLQQHLQSLRQQVSMLRLQGVILVRTDSTGARAAVQKSCAAETLAATCVNDAPKTGMMHHGLEIHALQCQTVFCRENKC